MTLDFLYQSNGLDVTFRIISKIPSNVIKIEWDFGDDSEIISPEKFSTPVKHTYEEEGFYTVTLKYTYTEVDPETSEEIEVEETNSRSLVLTTHAFTHLTDSIYNLINNYIPEALSGDLTFENKTTYINKWQLYIHPLVARPREHIIPLEEYNNELYYEGLENQLIMELAAWDYLNVTILNLMASLGKSIQENNSSKGDDPDSEGGNVKKITTGPTEVEYFEDVSNGDASLFKAYSQAVKPGGILDEIKSNLCMLAKRLEIYLPICSQVYDVKVPRVVNRRKPGPLGGPNPTAPIRVNIN